MQASFRSVTLQHCAKPAPGVPFLTLTTVLLVAGAAILRWLAQSIESQGLGDGTSLLITLSIVTSELTHGCCIPSGRTPKCSEWMQNL